jgi:RHS repeat-associated protein
VFYEVLFTGDSIEIGVPLQLSGGKYVDPKKIRLSPATFVRTGMDRKIIRTLGEYGQNLAAAPNELAIANVIALVIGELGQKPAPEAYMGYALYDSDSVLYEQGKVVLSKKARNKHEELVEKIAVKKDGYIETFLVNETSENVWFDQFRVMSTGPLIVQETHFDPWGVELSGLGYQYGGIKINPYLCNGKEANGHLGVNLYDYGARLYDPSIGRWFVVDPMAAHPLQIDKSPYAYGWNNPIRYIDPNGMCPNGCSEGEKTKDIYAEGAVVQNRFGASQYNDGKWKVISRAPMTENSSDGVRINGFFGGGSNSGEGGSNDGNGFFGSSGFGDFFRSNEASYVGASISGMNENVTSVLQNRGAYQSGLKNQRIKTSGQITVRTPIGNTNLSARILNGARIGSKIAGVGLGTLGTAFTTERLVNDPNYKLVGEGGLDLIMGGVGFIPGGGWVISGTYFLGKAALEYTGNDYWNK